MSDIQAMLWMGFLFALRCIVPIVLTLVIGYLMNKLVDSWEAEEARSKTEAGVQNCQSMNNVSHRFRPNRIDCWTFRNCEASDCPAYKNTAIVCWQKKQATLGYMPEACQNCPIYAQIGTAV
jgi:lipoate synthase